MTARQFAADVRGLAAGFLAAGIQPGDRVALMAATSYEWTLMDYALWTVAALPVPIYETSSIEQVRWVLEDARPVAVVVERETHRRLVEDVAEGMPQVWQIDGGGLDRLREGGLEVDDAQLRERRRAVTASDLATIIYTSGTTGRPKGCMLSHGTVCLAHSADRARLTEDLAALRPSFLLAVPRVFERVYNSAQQQAQAGARA